MPSLLRSSAARPAILAWLTAAALAAGEVTSWTHEEAPAPVDNPLKGLVPYANPIEGRFPHSMEFFYLPLSAVVKTEGKHDWKALDRQLDDIAGRGRQAVFRVYLEYPGQKDVIPAHLVAAGLKVHRYLNTNTAPLPPKEVATPDYEDPRLRRMLADFIAAAGERYDGDPRIGFITAGLLGTWGEWHTHPRPELFASKAVQAEVMDAYEKAFKVTPVLLRYPAGNGHHHHAPNARRSFGYHDDSFAWATLDSGRKEDGWFFIPSLKAAGPAAMDRWKSQPIGGEIRPEAWGVVFDESPPQRVQDFRRCVEETHVSWLMDSGMFRESAEPARLGRAMAAVRRMGYEFRVTRVEIEGRELRVALTNQGVAPFYYPWKARFRLLAADGNTAAELVSPHALTGILPGESVVWKLELPGNASREMKVLMQVPNPLPNGKPVKFANRSQDTELDGWLTLTPTPADP